MAKSQTDQDSPWKLVLRQYFPEAIAFFFPKTAKLIDWRKPITFLDKEFQQITPEAEIGRRFADLLVKVWLKRGKEVWQPQAVTPKAARSGSFGSFAASTSKAIPNKRY
ncbi:MAG: hypothetical protein MUF49_06795 [Oculatellaceae cyanobacterium Prado106]|jgi:hypothetical protein|nr:hypothetical protein [Oculatellaceae cyanobacterium Prado106]